MGIGDEIRNYLSAADTKSQEEILKAEQKQNELMNPEAAKEKKRTKAITAITRLQLKKRKKTERMLKGEHDKAEMYKWIAIGLGAFVGYELLFKR